MALKPMGIYQSSGRTRDPLGGVAMLIGIAGAFASVILWAYQLDPQGALVHSVASKLGPGLAFGDGLVLTAAICGGVAVTMAIAGSLGGSMRGASAIAIVFGVIALSYPVLAWFQVISRPLLHRFSTG
jgi:hypothetical protein